MFITRLLQAPRLCLLTRALSSCRATNARVVRRAEAIRRGRRLGNVCFVNITTVVAVSGYLVRDQRKDCSVPKFSLFVFHKSAGAGRC